MKVSWVNHKEIDFDNIKSLLNVSMRTNQMTNYGPVVRSLENFFTKELCIDKEKAVIVVANGAVGLHALVSGIEMVHGKKLYATQAFTFPCSAQGPLSDSVILDIDDDMGLDLTQVDIDNIDGIIVTNLFGHTTQISKYVEWAEKHNKILLFDNATVSKTLYKGINALNYGVGSIVSLHHTKPIGYGEGGLIIVDKKYEDNIRKCINFGFNLEKGILKWNRQGSNFKMSEISAAFILDYLKNFSGIVSKHIELYKYFLESIKDIDVIPFPNFSDGIPFVSCIPIIFPQPITTDHLYQLELLGITGRKYYNPLESHVKSTDIYNRILCLPCHIDLDKSVIDNYVTIIKTFL
jgi:dTDP-4-amino-4,6-dideoxygalactose transaminase